MQCPMIAADRPHHGQVLGETHAETRRDRKQLQGRAHFAPLSRDRDAASWRQPGGRRHGAAAPGAGNDGTLRQSRHRAAGCDHSTLAREAAMLIDDVERYIALRRSLGLLARPHHKFGHERRLRFRWQARQRALILKIADEQLGDLDRVLVDVASESRAMPIPDQRKRCGIRAADRCDCITCRQRPVRPTCQQTNALDDCLLGISPLSQPLGEVVDVINGQSSLQPVLNPTSPTECDFWGV